MIRRPPRSTLTHSFPTRRSSDLLPGHRVSVIGGDHRRRLTGDVQQDRGDGRSRGTALVDADEEGQRRRRRHRERSEEHTSELQSLMRISYAVFCLKKKKTHKRNNSKEDKLKQADR